MKFYCFNLCQYPIEQLSLDHRNVKHPIHLLSGVHIDFDPRGGGGGNKYFVKRGGGGGGGGVKISVCILKGLLELQGGGGPCAPLNEPQGEIKREGEKRKREKRKREDGEGEVYIPFLLQVVI